MRDFPVLLTAAEMRAADAAATSALGVPNLSRKIFRPARSRSMTTSQIACWNAAQRSRTSFSLSGAIFSASSRSAVFSPDSEKSASGRPNIGRGSVNRVTSPRTASRSTCGPPG